MKRILLYWLFTVAFLQTTFAQFAPPAGQAGSTAIYKDSSIIVAWATGCTVQRGYINIMEPSLGFVSFGNPQDATGPAGLNGVVSLGDGGTAILTFEQPITNGTGADFAIFENAFNDFFLELAFVEVSSDGINFARFPAVSLTQNHTQIDGFGTLDATKIHNLAGKYRANYGVPFDLDDINHPLVNTNQITHVKIIDVIGCIQPPYATYDSQGNIINDPFPTPYPTGGFDLDAVGVIYPYNQLLEKQIPVFTIFPNPCTDKIFIQSTNRNYSSINLKILNTQGTLLLQKNINHAQTIDISQLPDGFFILEINTDNNIFYKKILKQSK